ncbi:hypothetical protein LCGC14_3122490, partial [marine sediment metagenome]
EAPQIPKTGLKLPDIGIEISNWALKVGAALGAVIFEIGKGAFELGTSIGQWLYDEVIVPAGDFLSAKLFGIWEWTKDFPGWLWEKITSVWSWGFNFGSWLWEEIKTIWNYDEDFGGWLWGKITSIWDWTYDFAGWIWKKVTSIFAFGGIGLGLGKGQVGIPSVPSDGLYQLHRGEEVIPRTRAGQNRSVIFKPTFQISGNISQDIDMDGIVRRAGRITEMELKQRGII